VRILRVRRLRGGLGAYTHVLTLEAPDGSRENVVLRRHFVRESFHPERAEREFRTLQLVNDAGIPSPKPLHIDVTGEYFGAPALLLSYLPGRSLYEPRDEGSWTEQLARVMLSIHAISPAQRDLSWLPRFSRDEIARELEELRSEADKAGALARRVHAALIANLDSVAWPEPCLIHEDFWPGNTVWFRQRLVGVIDWVNAKVGDPRCDVTQCAIDAMLVLGIEAYDRLRATYQTMAPAPLQDLWYFDLFNGLRALIYYSHWLLAYRDVGLTKVTLDVASHRIQWILRRALKEASNATPASRP
jgi:aminoglycoside phosphotransferase (APT) family kinase protein